jgi:hypothetical protein
MYYQWKCCGREIAIARNPPFRHRAITRINRKRRYCTGSSFALRERSARTVRRKMTHNRLVDLTTKLHQTSRLSIRETRRSRPIDGQEEAPTSKRLLFAEWRKPIASKMRSSSRSRPAASAGPARLARNVHWGSGLRVGARPPGSHSRTPSPRVRQPRASWGKSRATLAGGSTLIVVLFLACLFKIARFASDKSG